MRNKSEGENALNAGDAQITNQVNSSSGECNKAPGRRSDSDLINLFNLPEGRKLAIDLLDSSPDGILILNTNSSIVYVNKFLAELFGYTVNELLGEPLEILIPARFKRLHAGHVEEYMVSPKLMSMLSSRNDIVGEKKSGEEFAIDVSLNNAKAANGDLIIATVRDVSDRQNVESMLREAKMQYKTLLDNSDELINLVSLEGKIIWANLAWRQTFKYYDEDISGLEVMKMFHEKSRASIMGLIPNVLKGESIKKISAVGVTRDGEVVDVEGSVIPVLKNGRLVAAQGFFRNVTEIKKERKERRKAESRLTRTLDKMLPGCTIVNYDWVFLYVNESAAKQVFQTPLSLIGKKMHDIYPGIEQTAVYKLYRRCMEEREYIQSEEKYEFENGITKWFQFQIEPVEEGIFGVILS